MIARIRIILVCFIVCSLFVPVFLVSDQLMNGVQTAKIFGFYITGALIIMFYVINHVFTPPPIIKYSISIT
jgi:hypothetical protein